MVQVLPYIPENITVHLGTPSSNAQNVTVFFPDYVKNVVSSEIYPTWEQSALRANILAVISFALNRVYLEHYRSRGFDFDITSSTAYDQSFVNGRNTFEPIDRLVDELFNDYLRRQGFVEPLAAKFCNGTTTTCEGLSQWGSQALAEQGYNSVQILRSYYGEDVEIVTDAPIRTIGPTYPGTPLRLGDSGPQVLVTQVMLNEISRSYPAIPKINPTDGQFDGQTRDTVIRFQQIFNLAADGIVGKATWYQMVRLYVAINRLAELESEGQTFYNVNWQYPDAIEEGQSGLKVRHLQYMLAMISEFVPEIPEVAVTGNFDSATKAAVQAFQRRVGLPENGVVGAVTWDAIYNEFIGIEANVFEDAAQFPLNRSTPAVLSVRSVQQRLRELAGSEVSAPEVTGVLDRRTQQAIAQFQRKNGLQPTGRIDAQLHDRLNQAVQTRYSAKSTLMTQHPGYDLRLGTREEPGA